MATFTSLLGSFTCRKFTTWDRRLYFTSEGRCAEDFFARKIRRLRPGLNPRTWIQNCSLIETINYTYVFCNSCLQLPGLWWFRIKECGGKNSGYTSVSGIRINMYMYRTRIKAQQDSWSCKGTVPVFLNFGNGCQQVARVTSLHLYFRRKHPPTSRRLIWSRSKPRRAGT